MVFLFREGFNVNGKLNKWRYAHLPAALILAQKNNFLQPCFFAPAC